MEILHNAGGTLTEMQHNRDIFEDWRNEADWSTPLRGAGVVAWLVKNGVEDDEARLGLADLHSRVILRLQISFAQCKDYQSQMRDCICIAYNFA